MRAMNIRAFSGGSGWVQLKASFKKNKLHYLQEAIGLAIFMISACFFAGMLESKNSPWHMALPNIHIRTLIMGVMMGLTALFIFYSPITAASGSHINPAVTITFLRLGKMCRWDALFYIIAQLTGGLIAVYFMAMVMGSTLMAAPVNYVVTVPGSYGALPAAFIEFVIAFLMISMVLFTSNDERFKKYTRVIAACFVYVFVMVAGPVSGFGMNPARTLASAIPAGIYTSVWIYLIIPFAGMLAAAEFFLLKQKHNKSIT
jgi:aquaporin Z